MFNNLNDESDSNNNSNNNNKLGNEIGNIFNRNVNNSNTHARNSSVNGEYTSLLNQGSPMTSPTTSPHASSRFLQVVKSKRKFSVKQQILPLVAMVCLASVVISLVIISRNYSANNMPGNQTPFVVINDDNLQEVAEAARAQLLKIHKGAITKLDFAILVLNPVGSWSIASYHGDTLSNASTCVYLPFLAAAVNWCLNDNQDPHCMQVATQPMMTALSSIHAGIVVDTVTHAPNELFKFENDTGFSEWLSNRQYVQNFLNSYGLLGNQTIINKIYPSNSGPSPSYGELIAQNIMGPNLMDPINSALLMLYVVFGGIVPEGDAYMTDLLTEQTFSSSTSLGFGLPPGSVLHSVLGTSTTDVNEIAHVILPNGRELVMAAFTDGYQNFGNAPYQSSILGTFAENLINGMNLTKGNPPCIILDTSQATISPSGGWKTGYSIQAYNNTYLYMNGGNITPYSVVWTIQINITGLYEVCIWFPAAVNQTNVAIYTVAAQSNENRQYVINQQHYGARWILLDSFYFVAGSTPMVHISNSNIPAGQVVVADTVKVTMWPTTDNIPGLAPSYVNENYDYAYN